MVAEAGVDIEIGIEKEDRVCISGVPPLSGIQISIYYFSLKF
jgi:hypothetical protein